MKIPTWLILFAIAVIAVITNPNKEKHEEAVKDEVRALILDPSGNSDVENIFEGLISGLLLDAYIEQAVSVDNYILFSLSKMNIDGKPKIIGVGLFGNVIVSSDKMENPLKNLEIDK